MLNQNLQKPLWDTNDIMEYTGLGRRKAQIIKMKVLGMYPEELRGRKVRSIDVKMLYPQYS